MALTTLDPNTALVVIDLQRGVVGLPTVHPVEGVVANATALVRAFRGHGLPVVLVSVDGAPAGRTEQGGAGMRALPEGWADLIPELDQQPDDLTVVKRSRGAFTHTGLDELLKSRGVTQVVVVGVATGSGVNSTANQAYEHGYHVTLATDAMTDMSAEAHEFSITSVFPRIGETGTTREVLDLLDSTRR
jgi:nicotinamidase-related amidase